jgi:hypothetical protein
MAPSDTTMTDQIHSDNARQHQRDVSREIPPDQQV